MSKIGFLSHAFMVTDYPTGDAAVMLIFLDFVIFFLACLIKLVCAFSGYYFES